MGSPDEDHGDYYRYAFVLESESEDTFIVYSASGFSSDHYCMGMLTLKGDDVMDKASWKKSTVRVSYHRPLK